MKLNKSYTHPDDQKHPKDQRSGSIPLLSLPTENTRAHPLTKITSGRYSNTTFGTAKRDIFLKPEHKQSYNLPLEISNKKYGRFSKAPRPVNLNISGRDSPNPSKYSINDSYVRPMESSFSFGQSYLVYSKVVVPGQAKQHIPSTNPGPGRYYFAKPIGLNKSKYSFGTSLGCSYLPNTLNNPPVTKYRPEKFELSQKSPRISIGLAERQFTYIPNKSDIPGPASYDPTLMENEKNPLISPKKGVSSKRSQSVRNRFPEEKLLLPGPGAYDLMSSYKVQDWQGQQLKAAEYRSLRRGKISSVSFVIGNKEQL